MVLNIFLYAVSLLVLYLVIETAVRNGINSSVVGEKFKEDYVEEESNLNVGLDNDHHNIE